MSGDEQVLARLAGAAEACRRHGIKATHQRMEILWELSGTEEHPYVETVYKSVRKRVPAISLDTVYRTLRLFEEKGVIVRMGAATDRARFDANTSRHHHFVCTQCGLVRDFCDEALDGLKAPQTVPEMGCVDSVYVELRGLCRSCRKQDRREGGK